MPYSSDATSPRKSENKKEKAPFEQFLEDLHKMLDPNYKRDGFQTEGKF
jgi:hypothetical protein